MMSDPISVVLCARNEASRIELSIRAIQACEPAELIVVDGGSADDTVAIAERLGARVIRSGGRGLAPDRQLGADSARHALVAFIDADHRPAPDALRSLQKDMQEFGLDVVQAGVGIEDNGFWNRAEHDAMVVFQHKPGPRPMMIGVAPTLYRREVLQAVRFDEVNKEQSDDADLFKRIVDTGRFTFGVGRTVVPQEHHAAFSDYLSKFRWYGRRDAEFIRTHSDRAHSMLFHLFFRYPVWRPVKSVLMGRPRAALYFWVCGGTRLGVVILKGIETMFGKKTPAHAKPGDAF
jgi:glycosyltransferase involved in cell wall biosynthesis